MQKKTLNSKNYLHFLQFGHCLKGAQSTVKLLKDSSKLIIITAEYW